MPTKPELTIAVATPADSIFIYTPDSLECSDAKPPPSPTSSLKACFVRSRPTSTNFSDFEYTFNDFSGLGAGAGVGVAEESSISRGLTSPPPSASTSISSSQDFMDQVTLATGRWARAQLIEKAEDRALPSANSDTRSLALSTLTASTRHTVVPVRIVRRSEAEADKHLATLVREQKVADVEKCDRDSTAEEGEGLKDDAKRRRTWPSYKAIRKTVSNIVHRTETPAPPPAPTTASVDTPTPAPEPNITKREHVKSSSASLFSRHRRATTYGSDSDEINVKSTSRPSFLQRALATSSRPTPGSTPLQHRARLRRSRSFSAFTTVLGAIVDAEQEQDEYLDEATAEARDVAKGIGRRWAFEEVLEVQEDENAGFLFERCVE